MDGLAASDRMSASGICRAPLCWGAHDPMLIDLLLPDVPGLALQGYSAEDDGITLIMASTCSAACCPLCGFASNREHSHYQRAPGDLPWSRLRILLRAELFGNDP